MKRRTRFRLKPARVVGYILTNVLIWGALLYHNFALVRWDEADTLPDAWERFVAHSFVINMNKYPERMKRMRHMLEAERVPFERIEGPDGSKSHHLCTDARGKSNQTIDDHFLGCSHAHYNVLMAALEQSFRSENDDRWILVFEDDALMAPGFKRNLLQAIQDCPPDGEMIQCWYGSSASPFALRVGKSLVDDGKKPSTRTGTYAINQKGARKWARILRDRQCTEHTDENPYYSSMVTYKCIKSTMPYILPLFLHSREQLACAK